jgi:polysaccharide export outer membrane protein
LQLKEVIEGKSAAANLKIEPGDVVAVTDVKQPQYVHIVGEVNKPGAVELVTQPTVSLLKLIAVAGGLTRTASSKHTVIRHVGDAGVQTDIAYINLGKIMAGKARDLQLSSGDIVVIGASNLKQYIQVASLAAVNAGVYVLATL